MEALRIIKVIESDKLPELNNYRGKKVEIIVFPVIDEENDKSMGGSILGLRGSIKKNIDGLEFQRRVRQEWEKR